MTKPVVFRDRGDAGLQLAGAVRRLVRARDVVVFGLPRSGLPVAYEIAVTLGAPLEVFVVRKLGAPVNPELAIGAIASGPVEVLHRELIGQLGLSKADVEAVRVRERAELERRERAYRGDRAFPELTGRTAILVDDGVATGATMEAAVDAMGLLGADAVVVAVPHGARDSLERIAERADQMVVLSVPEPYMAVGYWYLDFPQVSDAEVMGLLARARQESSSQG